MDYFIWEMDLLELLNKINNPFLNLIIWAFTEFGGSILAVGLIGLFYWCINKENGRRLGFIVFSSMTLNNILKNIFIAKRPFQYEGHEHLRKLESSILPDSATGSSFPSGHSQNAGCLYTSVSKLYPNKKIIICSIIMILMIPFSRLYFGCHFPRDVIVGLIIGIAYALLMLYISNKLDTKKKKLFFYLIIVSIFGIFCFFKNTSYDFFRSYGILLGLGVGCILEDKYIKFTIPQSMKLKIWRFVLGALIVGFLFILINLFPENVRHNSIFALSTYFLIGLTSFVGVPYVFKLIKI